MQKLFKSDDGVIFNTEEECSLHEEKNTQKNKLISMFYKVFQMAESIQFANYIMGHQEEITNILNNKVVDPLVFTLDGKEFIKEKEQEEGQCFGCAFEKDLEACVESEYSSNCSAEKIIWIKKP